jgi:hypothetical protein
MSKIILLIVSSCTFLFSAIVEEFPFIGVTVTTQTLDLKQQHATKETTATIRYGKQTMDLRTMFSFEFSSSYRSFNLEIDKILMDELFGKPEYRPYAGLTIGTLSYEKETLGSDSGYYYGAALGMIFYVTDTIDADLSYHYYKTVGLDAIDNLEGATVALHYFY